MPQAAGLQQRRGWTQWPQLRAYLHGLLGQPLLTIQRQQGRDGALLCEMLGPGPWACLPSNVPTLKAPSIGEYSAIHQLDRSKAFRPTEEQTHRSLSNRPGRGLSLKSILLEQQGAGQKLTAPVALKASTALPGTRKATGLELSHPGGPVALPQPLHRGPVWHMGDQEPPHRVPQPTLGAASRLCPQKGERGGPKQRLKW